MLAEAVRVKAQLDADIVDIRTWSPSCNFAARRLKVEQNMAEFDEKFQTLLDYVKCCEDAMEDRKLDKKKTRPSDAVD